MSRNLFAVVGALAALAIFYSARSQTRTSNQEVVQ